MSLNSHSTQSKMLSYIIICRFLLHCSLNAIGQETEEGTSPQKHGETTKHLKANKNRSHLLRYKFSKKNSNTEAKPLTVCPQERFRCHLFAEFDPLWSGWRRSEGIGSIAGQNLSSLLTSQPLP